ncbi:MAG TPA: AMP-dependent synthetase [Actinobacteria bacterium]|nr:AMP-dependent synthetase [Actinomycetota bacterium]
MTLFPGGDSLNIAHGIGEFAIAQPQTTAIIDGDRTWTYAELDARTNQVAHLVASMGLPDKAPVAILLGNRGEYMELAAGLARAGHPFVPLNPRMSASEVDYIMNHSSAQALFLDNALSNVAEGSVAGLKAVYSIDGTTLGDDYEEAIAAQSTEHPRIAVHENDAFCIAYTSGTTGKPKGVLISHRSRTLQFYTSSIEWGLGTGRRSIAVAPMYHGAGFLFGYTPVAMGGTVSMLRRWDPAELLDMVQRDKAQSIFLVPTHASMIKALGPEKLAEYDLSSLDTIYFNAAALPVALKEWVMEFFAGVDIHELYGSTEGGIVSNLRPKDAARKAGSVGHPWFMTEVRVVDDEGNPVPTGTPGELFSRSPFLMNGYLNDPEATAACTTDDGFLTCGDIVIVDDEGFISIVDRKKDMIISGGVNVYPRDVEEQIVILDSVIEAAVIGAPDETWGEKVVAYAVVKAGQSLTLEELDAHLRDRLAGYKIPRELYILEALPRNASGKVVKTDLRDIYADN